jgi:hypothetical protein
MQPSRITLAVFSWELGLSDHDSSHRLAANQRERAAVTGDFERRSRHLALAEHCELLAAATPPRPKGVTIRFAAALFRHAARLAQTASAT